MKNKKILIIGLGKIGLNHLKAAEKFKKKIDIYVFDKKLTNKNFGSKKINLIKNLNNNHSYDLVIISTNSSERFRLFLKLIKNSNGKNILFEKIVFFKIQQFLKTFKILKKNKINVWVNCLRREISIFHKIKKKIKGDFELTYKSKN
jgi:predicted dehydrogenase